MQISSAGPVSVARRRHAARPSRSPPARCTVTGLSHQPLATQRRAGGDRARARGERLPAPRSQTPTAMSCSPVDPDELDVGALGKALVVLDQRAEPQQARRVSDRAG